MTTLDQKIRFLIAGTLSLFLIIALRLVHLGLIEHHHYLLLSKKPREKTFFERSKRGKIQDDQGHPLAINKPVFKMAILYDEIRSIPRRTVHHVGLAKRKVSYPRKEYIQKLSHMLYQRFGMKPDITEDSIYSYASIFPTAPYTLKNAISKEDYYIIKGLEKDWPGLKALEGQKRFYPHKQLACHLLGYVGTIDGATYERHQEEVQELHDVLVALEEGMPIPLPNGYKNYEEVRRQWLALRQKSYHFQAEIGKAGLEQHYETLLKGVDGQKRYEITPSALRVKELSRPIDLHHGSDLSLHIDRDLQAFCEELLMESELIRDARFTKVGKQHDKVANPWIKGGSIIVMDPHSGQIKALASYPFFDPNDFTPASTQEEKRRKAENARKWLELPSYMRAIWEGEENLSRQVLSADGKPVIEEKVLSLELYLDTVLSQDSPIREALDQVNTVGEAKTLLNSATECVKIVGASNANEAIEQIMAIGHDQLSKPLLALTTTLKIIPDHSDRMLFLDLLRLMIPSQVLQKPLSPSLGSLSLSQVWQIRQVLTSLKSHIFSPLQDLFHKTQWRDWRKRHVKAFLKHKRRLEKENKRYNKPYLDYLKVAEDSLFKDFIADHHFDILSLFMQGTTSPLFKKYYKEYVELITFVKNSVFTGLEPDQQELISFCQTLNQNDLNTLVQLAPSFEEISAPLWGQYRLIKRTALPQKSLQDLALAFYPIGGFGYAKSYAYQEAAPQGSVFKVVTSYSAIKQHLEDHPEDADKDYINPLTITDASNSRVRENRKQVLGYHDSGKPIYRMHKGGRLLSSLRATGKTDLKRAFERSSNVYFGILASDFLKSPKRLTDAAKELGFGQKTGIDTPYEIRGIVPNDILDNRSGLYSLAVGQHSLTVTPLQTTLMLSLIANGGRFYKPHTLKAVNQTPNSPVVLRSLDMPNAIRSTLFRSLAEVVQGKEGSARLTAIRALLNNPSRRKMYAKIAPTMIGKSSSAEIMYRPHLDRTQKPVICQHTWFSALGIDPNDTSRADLVVTIYLRYGDYGKEAAPLAAAIIDYYRRKIK